MGENVLELYKSSRKTWYCGWEEYIQYAAADTDTSGSVHILYKFGEMRGCFNSKW